MPRAIQPRKVRSIPGSNPPVSPTAPVSEPVVAPPEPSALPSQASEPLSPPSPIIEPPVELVPTVTPPVEPAIAPATVTPTLAPVTDVPAQTELARIDPAPDAAPVENVVLPAKAPRVSAPRRQNAFLSRLVRLRAGWGWVFGVVALGLAFLGEKLADDARVAQNGQGAPPLASWLLFGAAGFLFVLGIVPAAPRLLDTPPVLLFFKSLRARRKSSRTTFTVLIGLALLCGIGSVPLFISLNATDDIAPAPDWLINTGPWLLYAASVILFMAALVVWERSTPAPATSTVAVSADSAPVKPLFARAGRVSLLPKRIEWIIIPGFFILALALRLPNLENAPPGLWFDEAYHGNVAQTLLSPGGTHRVFIADIVHFGAFYFYFLGAVLKIFGTSLWELRLLPALAGSLIVPMIYLLGSRLYGWRVGVAAAGLLVASSWNLTFSRFGMVGMFTTALDVGIFLCVVQGLRTGKLIYYAGAGVLLGFAVQTYYTARLVPFILLAVLVHRLITDRMRLVRSIRVGIIVFVLGALLASVPLDLFAVQKPDIFNNRIDTVTIFSQEGSGGDPNALVDSFDKHILMFNFQGDSNGRHNLPGRPMLDWLTAALFFAGLALAIFRGWRWQYFFPVAWFAAVLSGGVLSLLFEAPQAHRTLENSVVAPFVAAIFVGELWGALDGRIASAWLAWQSRRALAKSRKASSLAAEAVATPATVAPEQVSPTPSARRATRGAQAVLALVFVLSLVWVGFTNFDRYFNQQVNDQSVWVAMDGANKAAGQFMAGYDPNWLLYVSPIRANVPATVYLAPDRQAQPYPGSFILPFTEDRDVALLLDPTDEADVSDIVRIYPHAQVTVVTGPQADQPQLFAVHISKEDIASLRGAQRIDDSHSAATLKVDQFSSYAFGWQNVTGSADPPSLLIDGVLTPPGFNLTLGDGLHSVVISGTQGTKADFTNLYWSQNNSDMLPIPSTKLFDPTKVEPHGLTALIRQGDDFSVQPAQIRIDPQISFYFHITPLNRPYTIEWVGKIYAPVSGSYNFFVEQISRSHLLIDGKDVVENNTPNNTAQGAIVLQQGLHDIQLKFEDLDGFSHIFLYWQPPTFTDRYIIPSAFLLPQMGQYPDKPVTGAWPTIDQADDAIWARSSLNTSPQPTPDTSGQNGQSPPPNPQAIATPNTGKLIQPVTAIGGSGNATLPLPRAVAVAPDGTIYIYSEKDSKISKYKQDGTLLLDWTVVNASNTPVTEGAALLIKDNNVLFLDAASADLVTYSPDGTQITRTHICTCYFPRGMALSNDGNLWVTDTGFGHIFKVSFTGETISTLGGVGTTPGLFTEPASVWESPQNILFVADVGNKRMQSLTSDGKPLAQWPIGEGNSRDANRITGFANGDVLVAEYDSRSLVEYDANGKEQHRWTYAPQGASLIPAGIGPAGGDKFAVLFPFDNTAIVFDATP